MEVGSTDATPLTSFSLAVVLWDSSEAICPCASSQSTALFKCSAANSWRLTAEAQPDNTNAEIGIMSSAFIGVSRLFSNEPSQSKQVIFQTKGRDSHC